MILNHSTLGGLSTLQRYSPLRGLGNIDYIDVGFIDWLQRNGYNVRAEHGEAEGSFNVYQTIGTEGEEVIRAMSRDQMAELRTQFEAEETAQGRPPLQTIDTLDDGQYGTTNETVQWFNQRYGTKFGNRYDYLRYLWDNKGTFTDASMRYYLLPAGMNKYGATLQPALDYDAPDDLSFRLVKMGLMAFAAYAVGGALLDQIGTGLPDLPSLPDISGFGGEEFIGVTEADVAMELAPAFDVGTAIDVAAQAAPEFIGVTEADVAMEATAEMLDVGTAIDAAAQAAPEFVGATEADVAMEATAEMLDVGTAIDAAAQAAPIVKTAAESVAPMADAASGGASWLSTITRAVPIATSAIGSGAALYRAFNPSTLNPSMLTSSQREQLIKQAQLDAAAKQAQNKNVGLLLGVAALIGLLLADSGPTTGDKHANRTK